MGVIVEGEWFPPSMPEAKKDKENLPRTQAELIHYFWSEIRTPLGGRKMIMLQNGQDVSKIFHFYGRAARIV